MKEEVEKGNLAQKIDRFFDTLGFTGYLLLIPVVLLVTGIDGPAKAMERSLGAFGSPGTLILLFLALTVLRLLFGTVEKALPLLAGTLLAFLFFAGAFNLPFFGKVKQLLSPFPAFFKPGPALFAGTAATLLGSWFGSRKRGRSTLQSLGVLTSSTVLLFVLGSLPIFPEVSLTTLSVDTALSKIAAAMGKEYRNPEVEALVEEITEDHESTLKEKDRRIKELIHRLKKAKDDRAALEESAKKTKELKEELKESREALEKLKNRLDEDTPLLTGRDYPKAVQPADPAVRDFAVAAAASAPGAYDSPQGSRVPTAVGMKQIYLVHGAVASQWKYVSDPAVGWLDYLSPARRSLALGLAGDCDDFATLVASVAAAVGGRVRIIHGYDSAGGHAWAEVWLGNEKQGRQLLTSLSRSANLGTGPLEYHLDEEGGCWLVLDWQFGKTSLEKYRMEVAWISD